MQQNQLQRWLGPVTKMFALLVGYAVLGMTLMIGLEILLRAMFRISLQGADEIGGYVLAIMTTAGAAYTLLECSHTRIEILTERLPSMVKAVLNTVAASLMAAMAMFLAWRAVVTVQESIYYKSLSGTPLMTPLWLPQGLWAAGMVLFAIVATAVALHCLKLGLGDWRAINRFYGVKTLNEELAEIKEQTKDPSTTPAEADLLSGQKGTRP